MIKYYCNICNKVIESELSCITVKSKIVVGKFPPDYSPGEYMPRTFHFHKSCWKTLEIDKRPSRKDTTMTYGEKILLELLEELEQMTIEDYNQLFEESKKLPALRNYATKQDI